MGKCGVGDERSGAAGTNEVYFDPRQILLVTRLGHPSRVNIDYPVHKYTDRLSQKEFGSSILAVFLASGPSLPQSLVSIRPVKSEASGGMAVHCSGSSLRLCF